MLTIGLTGGIASGKSTVGKKFAELGAGFVDADIIARQAVLPDTDCYRALVAKFGAAVVLPNRELDRAQLRRRIFESEEERRSLENILHPAILSQIRVELRRMNADYTVVDVPLLVENDLQSEFDRVLVVDCSADVQLDRLMKRDGETEATAKNMIAAQVSREQRLAVADDIVQNDFSLLELDEQVAILHRYYLELARKI